MSLDLWAIGDIHGVYDEMQLLLDRIEAKSPDGAEIVFLGDYIDRGPKSLEVMRALMAGPRRVIDKWITIRGNHEQMMLDAIEAEARIDDVDHWLWNGGRATINSFSGRHYTAGDHKIENPPYWFTDARGITNPHVVEKAVPKDIAEWTEKLPHYFRTENHFFAHAGAEQGVKAEDQNIYNLLWMRGWENGNEYRLHGKKHQLDNIHTDEPAPWEWHVVYGHTPRRDPFLNEFTSGLDTGAVFGWGLTAARFDREKMSGPIEVLRQDTVKYT